MGVLDGIFSFAGHMFVERPARKKSTDELIDALAQDGTQGKAQIQACARNAKNQEMVRHIIGIERWGQQRLRTVFGQPFKLDEADEYYPPSDLDLDQLEEQFAQTRDETVKLARRIADENAGDAKVRHNQMGEFSARGWLYYLDFHAKKEFKTLKS